jgi:hypothetical protein
MSGLSQITYDNMDLIFLSYFHGYNKNEIFADYWVKLQARTLAVLPHSLVGHAMTYDVLKILKLIRHLN